MIIITLESKKYYVETIEEYFFLWRNLLRYHDTALKNSRHAQIHYPYRISGEVII